MSQVSQSRKNTKDVENFRSSSSSSSPAAPNPAAAGESGLAAPNPAATEEAGPQPQANPIMEIDNLRDEWESMREALQMVEAKGQKYADLYHKAPIGVLALDKNGVICSLNTTAAGFWNLMRANLVGTPLLSLVSSPSRPTVLALLAALRRGKRSQRAEIQIPSANGKIRSVELTITTGGESHDGVLLYHGGMLDITDRLKAEQDLRHARDELESRVRQRTIELTEANEKLQREIRAHQQAAAALRVSQTRLQAILEHSPYFIFLKDVKGRYLLLNQKFAGLLGLPGSEIIGKTDADLFPRETAAAFQANDMQVIKLGASKEFEEIMIQDDGPHACIVSKFPLRDSHGRIYALGGIAVDITLRKRLEAEVINISQRERMRIAQDLHDGLGQELAGIACLAGGLKRSLSEERRPAAPARLFSGSSVSSSSSSSSPRPRRNRKRQSERDKETAMAIPSLDAQTAARISTLLDNALAHTRSLAQGLYPVPDQPDGLVLALEQMADRVSEMFKVRCEFHHARGLPEIDSMVANHLYRIAQEAVTNSIKHGRATIIKISLSSLPGQIVLTEEDNGSGLAKHRQPRKGMGVGIMGHRAGMMGGSVIVRNKDGGGAEMICTVPESGGRTLNPAPEILAAPKRSGGGSSASRARSKTLARNGTSDKT